MRFSTIIAIAFAITGTARAEELNRDQRLVVACHRLDVDGVVISLREGADVNARFGEGNANLLQDPWTLGWPMAAKAWTPLIALASSSKYPDPPRKVKNTVADLDWAREKMNKVDARLIEMRERDSLTIALILLSLRADIDANDGYGATALYEAVYLKKLELAKLLLHFNAKVNTKTGHLHRRQREHHSTTSRVLVCRANKAADGEGCRPEGKGHSGQNAARLGSRFGRSGGRAAVPVALTERMPVATGYLKGLPQPFHLSSNLIVAPGTTREWRKSHAYVA